MKFSFFSSLIYLLAYQPESIVHSSSPSSNISSQPYTLPPSTSYEGFDIHVTTDTNKQDEHADVEENLCINGTPVIQEDYTVVLQMIKHGLDTDSFDFDLMAQDAFEQFKSEIDQLNR